MTNKNIARKIEIVVDAFLIQRGLSTLPGQKGGDRETGNVMVGLALDDLMPQLLDRLGITAADVRAADDADRAAETTAKADRKAAKAVAA